MHIKGLVFNDIIILKEILFWGDRKGSQQVRQPKQRLCKPAKRCLENPEHPGTHPEHPRSPNTPETPP